MSTSDFPRRYTFGKPEHLCLERDINQLFSSRQKSIIAFPLRLLMLVVPYSGSGPHAKVLISVSKRHFKHAVDRNRAKRQVREAYRLQKHRLLEHIPEQSAVHLAFIWLSDDPMPSDLVHKRMLTLLNRAADRLQMGEAPQSNPSISFSTSLNRLFFAPCPSSFAGSRSCSSPLFTSIGTSFRPARRLRAATPPLAHNMPSKPCANTALSKDFGSPCAAFCVAIRGVGTDMTRYLELWSKNNPSLISTPTVWTPRPAKAS